MVRISLFIILSLLCLNVYSFWIWSPKTKKWKNPKYAVFVIPYFQFKQALEYFKRKNYRQAYQEFRKFIIHYPDAKEAAEAQYYLGRILEELGKPYQAYLEYQKIIDNYPNSKKINEVVERQYNIGEYFLNRKPKKWLGISVYDFTEHPAIEIFKKIVDKAPYSPFASRAQYKLGLLFLQLGRYDEAKDAFEKVINNYPDSEWLLPSKYQLAIATARLFSGADYDSSSLKKATRRLDEFIEKHPEAKITLTAKTELEELRNREAKKNFDIAQFYEKQRRYEAATIYYQLVLQNYSETEYAKTAREKIKELKSK